MDEVVKVRLLKAMENGENAYHALREEQFLKHEKKLSDTISKFKLPRINSSLEQLPIIIEKKSVTQNDVEKAQQQMDVAKA